MSRRCWATCLAIKGGMGGGDGDAFNGFASPLEPFAREDMSARSVSGGRTMRDCDADDETIPLVAAALTLLALLPRRVVWPKLCIEDALGPEMLLDT